ncbi:MAG: Zn-binding domain-containing protein [Candidatus Helarchaeota archaeon]
MWNILSIKIINKNAEIKDKIITLLERSRALKEVYPGAIYFYKGTAYRIKNLDLEKKIASAVHIPNKESVTYTKPIINTNIKIIDEEVRKKIVKENEIIFGEVKVIENITAYTEFNETTHEYLNASNLDLPQIEFKTQSCWIPINNNIIDLLNKYNRDLSGSIYAIEHIMISILPLFAMCDRRDLGGCSFSLHLDLRTAGTFIYDAYPGGIGLTEKGYEIIEDWLKAALKVIKDCKCYDGYLSCIMSPRQDVEIEMFPWIRKEQL